MTQPLLKLSAVSARLGEVRVLNDVSLTVHHNQILGVIGPNGAGKTTLLNIVCRLVPLESGYLVWKDVNLLRCRPHHLAELGIARTLQDLGLFSSLTVLENVMIGATRYARSGPLSALLAARRAYRDDVALRSRAEAQMSLLGIRDVGNRMPDELPHGIRKKVALARALVAEPALLLLDEPAAGLSASEVRELADQLPILGPAVLLIEHRMDLVAKVCDSVAVLNFGKLIAQGPPEEIRKNPQVVQAYLGPEVADGA